MPPSCLGGSRNLGLHLVNSSNFDQILNQLLFFYKFLCLTNYVSFFFCVCVMYADKSAKTLYYNNPMWPGKESL